MSMALRKLQAEIDRTLKAVALGVETFEQTFDKLNHASNATQKDKLENDLKTQIKKLQRMRDQIKAWLGSSDIKDKSSLTENRKLIETQMERFKALEKEMKMKAFSKEGLIAQSKLDPAEKAKRDMIDWIGTTTDELSRQIEATEAEAEQLNTGRKKKGQGDRLSELEELNERRTWHIGRMEIVQRMLENGQLGVEQVETIQEDVKYFVEANTEEDFDYDIGIYDELNLQDEEEFPQDPTHNDDLSNIDSASIADENADSSSVIAAPSAPKTPAKEEKEKKATPAKLQTTPGTEEPPQPPSPIAAKKQPSRKSTMEVKVGPSPSPSVEKTIAASTPTKDATPAPAPTVPKATPLPPIRYAAAAAAAVASTPPALSTQEPAAAASPQKAKVEAPSTSPQLVSEPEEQIPAEPTRPQSNGHGAPPPPPGLAAPSQQPSSSSPAQPVTSPASLAPAPIIPNSNNGSVSGYSPNPPPGYTSGTHAESSRAGSSFGASPRPQQGVMGNLMQSFDMAKSLSERRGNDVNELQAALDGSYANAPHQADAEPPRYYHPKNPVKTPSYYPQTRPPALEDKSLYSRLEMDQLFYIFYYMVGSYEQWLVAQELKRQSWRFHKQYLTWFQRSHNPTAITEDYEQGGYFYFDWENSWCQRKKSDFRFEYRWLSEH